MHTRTCRFTRKMTLNYNPCMHLFLNRATSLKLCFSFFFFRLHPFRSAQFCVHHFCQESPSIRIEFLLGNPSCQLNVHVLQPETLNTQPYTAIRDHAACGSQGLGLLWNPNTRHPLPHTIPRYPASVRYNSAGRTIGTQAGGIAERTCALSNPDPSLGKKMGRRNIHITNRTAVFRCSISGC